MTVSWFAARRAKCVVLVAVSVMVPAQVPLAPLLMRLPVPVRVVTVPPEPGTAPVLVKLPT